MDRRSLIKNTGMAGILAAGVAPAVHAQAALRWRLTSSFPKALDTLFGVNDVFAAKVKEMTGGKFEITTHAAGELVPAFGTIDATGLATLDKIAQGGVAGGSQDGKPATEVKVKSVLLD